MRRKKNLSPHPMENAEEEWKVGRLSEGCVRVVKRLCESCQKVVGAHIKNTRL